MVEVGDDTVVRVGVVGSLGLLGRPVRSTSARGTRDVVVCRRGRRERTKEG